MVHQKWRFISARATNSGCFRRKAGFLLKLEVLEARGGVCMWGRSWLRPPEEGMKSHQAWGSMCAAAVPAYIKPC